MSTKNMKKPLVFSALVAVFGLVIYSSFLLVAKADVPNNLVEDSGFETSMSNFETNQDGTSLSVTSINPINGSRSLVVGTTGYGDSVLWQGKDFSTAAVKRSSQFTGSVRVRSTVASASKISFCGLVEYVSGEGLSECKEVTGTVGDKGTISLSFALDSSRDLERVRVGIFQEGSAALREVLVDDVTVVLAGISPTTAPAPTPVTGVCGSANGTTVASVPTAGLCASGTASTVSGSGPWAWTCAGSNGGGSASCSANLTQTQVTSHLLSASVSGSGTITSVPSGISCGSACSANFTSGTSVTLTATPAAGQTFGGWNGACSGTGSCVISMTSALSVSASFSAISSPTPVNAVCGSANGTTVSTIPTSNLCSSGTASTVAGSGPWTWTCAGSNGGTNASCSAQRTSTVTPVNGVCGSANGTTVSTIPTSNLCSSGTASTVAGSGPWTWTCAGSNGGTTGSCSAQKTAAPVSSANNLIEDSGFETSMSNFETNQAGTSLAITTVSPINGSRSLVVGTTGYGDSVLWEGKYFSNLSVKRSSQFTGSVRVRSTVASASKIAFCAMIEYATGGDERNCKEVAGTVGDKGTISFSLPLDNTRDLDRVRVGIFQEGGAALRGVLIDDVIVVLAGISPTTAPSPTPVNAVCGSANGTTVSTIPTSNLCSSGTASTVAGSGPWTWTCAGSNGGTNASCSAQRTSTVTPVNGVCGSANGTTVSTIPTSNLCSSGTASTVAGSGPWTWTCAGSNGGTTGSCSAQRSITAPPSVKFTIGQRVQTTAGLNVRSTANTAGTLLGTQSAGALGTVTAGPTAQGGFNWWQVNYDSGADGYSVENYLTAYSSAPTPTPTPIPGGTMTFPAFNLNDPADAPLIKFAETWARNWNFEGHTVDPNFSGNSGNWNYTETTYEPWLFDRASVGFYLYKRTTDPTQKSRWYQQFLSDFAYYRNHIDSAGIFTPKGYGDTKYSYITPFLLYEKETGDAQYRPIAQRIYNAWLSDFSSTYSPNGNDLWTEREIGLALEAAVSWYELTGDTGALSRANALVAQWTVVANAGGGVPLTTVDRHEGGGGSQLITSPWMSGLYFQAARRLYALTGNTEVLQQVTRYADWMEQYAYFDAGIVDDPYAGITAAYYLVGPTGPYTPETPSPGDLDHCLDVSGIVSFAISAKQLLGQSATALSARHAQLRTCAVYAFNDATRTTITLPKYRVNPPRKFNWWMRSTLGYNGPTSPTTPPPTNLVNGVCGSANGTTVASAPTANLCSAGTASSVIGTGPWTWTCAGSNGGTTASCSAQRTATAPTTYTLSVSVGGNGTITSVPTGISCGATCFNNFASGSSVTLSAAAAPGNTFVGWNGGLCSGTGTCVVSMTAARSVGATFATNITGTSVRPLATSHPRVLINDAATFSRLQAALAANSPGASRFRTMVNNELANPGTNYAFANWGAALMYRLTGSASYGVFAVSKIDAFVDAEMARINAGQRPIVAGDSYLEIGDLVGDVALVYDWAYDLLTPTQRTKWINYMNMSLNNLWGNPESASWGGVSYPWSGWSLNDPYNNYFYSFIEATMFTGLATYEENPQAQQWLNKFYNEKVTAQLLPAMNTIPGGGSREGTGYGTALARLFKLYFWWDKSTGISIANQTPHTLGSMFWFAHSVVPSLDKLVPTGDHSRDSTAEFYDYHRDLLQNLISLYPNEVVSGAVKQLLASSNVPQIQYSARYWSDFINEWPGIALRPLSALNTTYFGTGTGNFYSRSSWNTNAIMVHMMAGPYNQSHAHRDQGSFLLNAGGTWLFDDANRRSSSGIELDEEMHNLVRFSNGGTTVRQVEGAPESQILALSDGTLFSYELASTREIYNGKPEVVRSEREFLFIKAGAVITFDRAIANSTNISRIYQLQLSAAPTISGNRLTFVQGTHRADVWRMSPTNVPWTTVGLYGGTRAEGVDTNGSGSLFLHVIGVDNKVSSVVSDNTASETGARITFTDGSVATVRFSNAGHGGTLQIVSGGTSLYNGALPTAVNTFPLYQ